MIQAAWNTTLKCGRIVASLGTYVALVVFLNGLQPIKGDWTSWVLPLSVTLVCLWWPSNYLTKEFLGLYGVLPENGARQTFQAGRAIGPLERILAIVCIATGQPIGIGFLVAAKGFIRSKDLETREFAEYFLLGTLSSILLALPLGAIWARYASLP